MRKVKINTLKALKKLYAKIFNIAPPIKPLSNQDPESAALAIYNLLISNKPCMIARFGSNELNALVNYIGIQNPTRDYVNYIKGQIPPWWWETTVINQLNQNAGFFSSSLTHVRHFCEMMINDLNQVDILGSWLGNETYFEDKLKDALKVRLLLLDPYWSELPWTKALEGKKVLVVHPFADTIEKQYKNRTHLFKDNLLPDFNLTTIKAVQTIAGQGAGFSDWFEALESMKTKIDKVEYDICLIGCGAYGFPLAAHVKRMGKKGFHMGGSLQLLFGIRGKRWENQSYSSFNYSSLMNEYWVKPGSSERPVGASTVEGACYW